MENRNRNAQVTGNNIVDLVNDAMRKRKSFQPVGWKTFARGLNDVNAHMDLVSNPEHWINIQTTTASVAGGASKETTQSRAAVIDVLHCRRRRAYLVSAPPLCNTRDGIRIKQSHTTPRCYDAMAGRVDDRH